MSFPSGQKKLLRIGSKNTRVKAGLASYLLRFKSRLVLGWVGSGPITNIWFNNGSSEHSLRLMQEIVRIYPTLLGQPKANSSQCDNQETVTQRKLFTTT